MSMTPAAAAETSDRLLHAATEAAGQTIMDVSRNERPGSQDYHPARDTSSR